MAATYLTADRARELLDYNPDTGIFHWKESRSGAARPGDVAGSATDQGYQRICIDRRGYKAHRLAWLITHGSWPADELDHVNRVRNDNRIKNLRESTRSLNMTNIGPPVRELPVGVYLTKHNRYRAQTRVAGKAKYIGTFATLGEASDAVQSVIAQRPTFT